MITINLTRNDQNQIVRFTVKGHAGYGEEGTDIVCASCTTAAFTAVNGLTDILKIDVSLLVEDGFLDCILPENLSAEDRKGADILLESMLLSFINVYEQFKDYVSIREMK